MYHARITRNDFLEFFHSPISIFITPMIFLITFLFISKVLYIQRRKNIFLLDFACFKPPLTQACTKEMMLKKMVNFTSNATLETMRIVLERSGLGDSTYFSEGLLREPPSSSLEDARDEAESAMFGAVDQLLAKTGLKCKDIGIVIVNCTLLNIVPSLSDMIVNRYKLEKNVLTYNLTGMGCSAGLLAINLAKQLLQVHQNTYALIYSTETITQHVYMGEERSMVLANTLFRVGGAAILLSNRSSDCHFAKYQLLHSVQTNTSRYDNSYNCIFRDEDDQGHLGVRISKDLMSVAIKVIESNITTLGHLVLPISEKINVVINLLIRYFNMAKIKPYIPQFNKAIDHVFPHVGGKPVLDAVQSKLGFTASDLEPSRMTLYRFGNTSSSSVWYALAYSEAKRRIKRGDRLWQLTYGSGFKCNSVIWHALRSIDFEKSNPWSNEIHGFPVSLQDIVSDNITFENILP